MGKIASVDAGALTWVVGDPNPDTRFKQLATAGADGLNAQVIEYKPGVFQKAHSHPHSEVIYVLAGSGSVGPTALKPGVFLHISANTVYGPLQAGPEGLLFFRVQVSPGPEGYLEAEDEPESRQ